MLSGLLGRYSPDRQLTFVWVLLLALTLVSTLVAEQNVSSAIMVIFICFSFAIKGALVTERLMGLWRTAGAVRWLMLSYFMVLPLLIGLAILFPGLVERLTTL